MVVVFEKMAVEALVNPIGVPSMVPPVIVTLEEVKLIARRVVPDAEVKAKAVVVAFVVVVFEKIPVEAFVRPIGVPSIVPPLIVTFDEVKLIARRVVPDAEVNAKAVVVAFVVVVFEKIPVEALVNPIGVPSIVPPLIVTFDEVKLIARRVVPDALVKARAVVVAFVVVVFEKIPVEALVNPMGVPLILPPVMVTLGVVMLVAFTVVPLAVV